MRIIDEIRIMIPNILNSFQTMKFSCYVRKVPLARKYLFDFSNMNMVVPFGALAIAKVLSQFAQRVFADGNEVGIKPEFVVVGIDLDSKQAHSYAAHIGFFKLFNCGIGNDVAQASGSATYYPIRFIDVESLHKHATETRRHYGYVIEEASSQLARFLTRQDDGNVVDLLTYSIREMMRNVVEHSGANKIWYCGQYYPSMHKVEIAILDEGVGIHNSLSKNTKLGIESNLQAIQLALCPGISRVSQRSKRFNDEDEWANSGYGLYATSKLCMKCGGFLVLSGSNSVLVDEKKVKVYNAAYDGTAIHVSISLDKVVDFKATLSSIIKEGSGLARKSIIPANPTASMISRMLGSVD